MIKHPRAQSLFARSRLESVIVFRDLLFVLAFRYIAFLVHLFCPLDRILGGGDFGVDAGFESLIMLNVAIVLCFGDVPFLEHSI